jgi:cell division septal protein FtsQ
MHQSISKKRIYFYLLLLILLSSTFNFNAIIKLKKFNQISHINVLGLKEKEKNILEKNLAIFINKNIFLINKKEVHQRIKFNNFIENYNIIKIFPSKLLVNVNKTEFVGRTILDGEKFYIGKNGKLTKFFLVEKEYSLPQVFGKFKVNQFLKLQKILNKNGFNLNKIKNYYYFKSNRWDIQNNDGVVIMLPSRNIESSLRNYRFLLKEKKFISSKTIDLRIKNKIILTNEKR